MYTMEAIAAAEKARTLSSFTTEEGWKLGVMARELCMERKLPVTICVEKCGQVVFQCALEGTTPDNDRWMAGKRNVVRLTHHSSLYAKVKVASRGGDLEEALGLSRLEYRCVGGSVPVLVSNVGVVGSLTVSGLADTEDHELVMELLQRFRDMQEQK